MQHRSIGFMGSVIAAAACTCILGCAPPRSLGSAPPKLSPAVAVAAAIIESPAPIASPAADDEGAAPPIEYEKWWQGFGVPKCSYLAPKADSGFIGDDGGVDVVFHFHAGQMSEREMKQSGVRGVFVSCGYGMGTGGYSSAFEDPNRFNWMMKRLMHTINTSAKRKDAHVRHLALVSWSAGFASVNRILAVPEWYEATDTVVLLDSLHAQYIDTFESPNPRTPSQGVDKVDVRGLRRFGRFAKDAIAGKKTMVMTHSAIVPPDYASTSEATAALLSEIGVSPEVANCTTTEKCLLLLSEKALPNVAPRLSSMALVVRVDEGNLHVRGFRGMGPRDHFDHLHLIGEALRSWVVPHWYTPIGERP